MSYVGIIVIIRIKTPPELRGGVLKIKMVEAAGIEPASAISQIVVLHAYSLLTTFYQEEKNL